MQKKQLNAHPPVTSKPVLLLSLTLKAKETSQKRSWHLLSILPKRGPNAFSIFCTALRETEQDHLYELLTSCTDKEVNTHPNVSHMQSTWALNAFTCTCMHGCLCY